MSKLLLPFALLLAMAVACNGGGDPAGLTDREITDEELSAMVLPQSDLGPEYADFEWDEDESGFHSNQEAIDDAFDEEDQEDEAQDIEKFGRVNGYEEQYMSMAAIMGGEGAALIATQVDLLKDADGASGYFRDGMEDASRQLGKTSGSVTAESMEQFDTVKIADEAAGYVFRATTGGDDAGMTMHGTAVGFRRGRIIGSSVIIRLDDQDMREEATALAQKLDERIQAVLRGEIEAEPTARPEPTAEAERTSEPAPESDAGVLPSDVLTSFRFSAEINNEMADSTTTVYVEGEFQAPDRLRCMASVSDARSSSGSDTRTAGLVVIGDHAWTDTGQGFEPASADDPDVAEALHFCPGSRVFWESFDLSDNPDALHWGPEIKNGVQAMGYKEALNTSFQPPGLEGLTTNTIAVWFAEEGRWPVALEMDLTADAKATGDTFYFPGTEGAWEVHVTVRADITNANDDDIHVEPPGP